MSSGVRRTAPPPPPPPPPPPEGWSHWTAHRVGKRPPLILRGRGIGTTRQSCPAMADLRGLPQKCSMFAGAPIRRRVATAVGRDDEKWGIAAEGRGC